jgi:DNA-binding transcriptional ArsR family regulator
MTDGKGPPGGSLPAGPVEIEQLAELFRQASDPTRLRLLFTLLTGELCVCELAGVTGITVSGVSHQLRSLRSAGLVSRRKAGRHVYYRLADDHVHSLLSIGMEHVRE